MLFTGSKPTHKHKHYKLTEYIYKSIPFCPWQLGGQLYNLLCIYQLHLHLHCINLCIIIIIYYPITSLLQWQRRISKIIQLHGRTNLHGFCYTHTLCICDMQLQLLSHGTATSTNHVVTLIPARQNHHSHSISEDDTYFSVECMLYLGKGLFHCAAIVIMVP